ncbi:MAG: WD40/YVTN/BNR-like repeat-containing protein, partial [Dehalococcoidia bacterium]
HGIDLHPTNPDSLVATISAGGAYRTDDGGASWRPVNQGVRMDFAPEEQQNVPAGHCVHKLVRSPADPEWLFQQNHCGPHRSADGGATWEPCGDGLPSGFGFPAAAHPHEPRTVYVAPLAGDGFRVFPDGALAVWRSRDGGGSWEPLRCGLPQQGAYTSAYRSAMATDREDSAGVYLGTATGQVFFSGDDGDHWELIADFLPPILSLEAA